MNGRYYQRQPLAYNGPRRTTREERSGLLRREQMHPEATRAYDPTCDGEEEDYDDDGIYDDGYYDVGYDDDDYDHELGDAHSMVLHDHTKTRANDHWLRYCRLLQGEMMMRL